MSLVWHKNKRDNLNVPRNCLATFACSIDLIQFGEGLFGILEESEGVQYFIQRTLLIGIGVTEVMVALFTFRGKGWTWNSNVVSQLAIFVLLTITLIQFFGDSSGLDEDVVLVAPLPIILIQIIIAILVLIYLFTPKVRSYFGKRNFSIRRLMYIDREGAWHYLHHLWIASLFTSILFSMIGLLLLVLVPQDLDVVLIASLSFMSAIVIVGLAFEACKRKSRLSTVYFPSLYL